MKTLNVLSIEQVNKQVDDVNEQDIKRFDALSKSISKSISIEQVEH